MTAVPRLHGRAFHRCETERANSFSSSRARRMPRNEKIIGMAQTRPQMLSLGFVERWTRIVSIFLGS